MGIYYKVAKSDGWDKYTGNTINYRNNIGKRVVCPTYKKGGRNKCCSEQVIHASKDALDAFGYVRRVPCSVFKVKGTPLIEQGDKAGFRSFEVLEELDFKKELGLVKLTTVTPRVNPRTDHHLLRGRRDVGEEPRLLGGVDVVPAHEVIDGDARPVEVGDVVDDGDLVPAALPLR